MKKTWLIVGYMIILSIIFKPVEWFMAQQGYGVDATETWTAQVVVASVVIIVGIIISNKRKEKDYENAIQKKLRDEQRARERVERENYSKGKKR